MHDIAALQVSTKARQEASFNDLERFFLSIANFDYVAQLYAFSHYPAGQIDLNNMQIDQAFPPHLHAMVPENATLSNWFNAKKREDRKKIASVNDLEGVSDTQDSSYRDLSGN